VDSRYLTGYPPGQVELDVFVLDADTLTAWVAKHTGPAEAASSKEFYWGSVANLAATTVSGQPGLAFDYSSEGSLIAVHSAVFMQGSSRVFLVDWWAGDSVTEATIKPVFQQMLASLRA
jgi:hypothetical protein